MGKRAPFKASRLFIKYFIKKFIEDKTMDLAATCAYYFLLSLFPLIIFLFAIIPYIGLTQEEVLPMLSRYVPVEVTHLIEQNMSHVFSKHGSLLSFGVIATIWPASSAINALIRTLNHAYKVKETRPLIVTRFMAICFTVAMIFAITMTLVINVLAAGLEKKLFHYLSLSDGFANLWSVFSTLVTFVIIIIIFACLYCWAPNKKLKFREVIIGAIAAGVSWQLASYAFSFYVRYFGQYSATYGTLGGIIVLMLWFYITAITVIIGGQINAVYRFFKINKNVRRKK